MSVETVFDTVPPVGRLIHDFLEREREAEGKREITGNRMWRASKLGSCLRAQYLEFALKAPYVVPEDGESTKRFEVGHVWGEIFRRWFDRMGLLIHEEYELDDPELNVGAHVDFIIGNEDWRAGIEVKSMQSRYFWWRKREGEGIASQSHLVQAATYDLLMRKRGVEMPWAVVVVSKDDLTIDQTVVTETHRYLAQERLAVLNGAVARGEAPACTCADPEFNLWGGREWKWCSYYSGENPEKRKDRNAQAPPHDCCALPEPAWL